jgi:hypothetical protein
MIMSAPRRDGRKLTLIRRTLLITGTFRAFRRSGRTRECAEVNANQNQTAITCTATQQGTMADFAGPDGMLPPGTSPTDRVTFVITVAVIPGGR